MKRMWCVALGDLVLGVSLAGRSEPATESPSHKPKLTTVAVLPCTLPRRPDPPDDLGQTLVDAMNTALQQSGRFQVVDRAMLGPLLDQIRFDSHGFVYPESARHAAPRRGKGRRQAKERDTQWQEHRARAQQWGSDARTRGSRLSACRGARL